MGLDQYIEIGVDRPTVDAEKRRVIAEHIYEKLAYFGKVNFLQKFFEDKYEVPNNEHVRITKEDLQELADLCEQVMDKFEEWDGAKEALTSCDRIAPPKHIQDYAEELLSTREGLSFGSTAYDNRYFNDIKYVLKTVRKILQEAKVIDDYPLFYRAWW